MPLCDGTEAGYEETWLNLSIPTSAKNNFLKEEPNLQNLDHGAHDEHHDTINLERS